MYCCDLFIRDFALAGENHGDQYTIDNFQSFLSVWIQAIDPAAVSKTNRKTEQIERGPRDRNGGEIAEASSCCTPQVFQPFPGAHSFSTSEHDECVLSGRTAVGEKISWGEKRLRKKLAFALRARAIAQEKRLAMGQSGCE